jgi:hypothetical protein
MAWLSSIRLVDLMAELPIVRMQPTDAVPILSDGIVKRIPGNTTKRFFENLSGPMFVYETRWWNGAELVIPQTGYLDLGDEFDLDITRATEEGADRQYASVNATPVGYDWQALGGAPDTSPLTFVVGFVAGNTVASSTGRTEATFEVDGDMSLRFSLLRVYDTSGDVEMEFVSGSDSVNFTAASDLLDELHAGVVVMTLDLPDNTNTGLWINGEFTSLTANHTGSYADGAPFPVHDDENAVVDVWNAYLGRDQPSRVAGQFQSAFSMALYRGAPSSIDLEILQGLYQPGFMTD